MAPCRAAPLAIAGLLLASVVSSSWAEPFDLRGIRLGITLAEFRQLPFPDGGGAKVLCEGDPEGKDIHISGQWTLQDGRLRGGGGLACGFFSYKTILRETAWYNAGLQVATVIVVPAYVFVPDQSNVLRLYTISIRYNSRHWPIFWEGYTGRYGQPSQISKDSWRNTMDNVIATWENSESTIILAMRTEELEISRIWYIHKGLSDLLDSRELPKKGRPKDNL